MCLTSCVDPQHAGCFNQLLLHCRMNRFLRRIPRYHLARCYHRPRLTGYSSGPWQDITEIEGMKTKHSLRLTIRIAAQSTTLDEGSLPSLFGLPFCILNGCTSRLHSQKVCIYRLSKAAKTYTTVRLDRSVITIEAPVRIRGI